MSASIAGRRGRRASPTAVRGQPSSTTHSREFVLDAWYEDLDGRKIRRPERCVTGAAPSARRESALGWESHPVSRAKVFSVVTQQRYM